MSEQKPLEELFFVPGEDFESAILTLWAHVRHLETTVGIMGEALNRALEQLHKLQQQNSKPKEQP